MNNGFAVKERPRFILSEHAGSRECFFLFRQGEEDGPYSFEELEAMHRAGEISPATPCRSRAAKEWHDLAYVLREAAEDPVPEPARKGPAQSSPSSAPKVEPMNKLVMELIELSRRQNRLLASIKWSLLGLVMVSAIVAVAVVLNAI